MPSSETYTGWGSGPWSRNGWGTPQVLVSVDGVGATAELGSATAVIGTTNLGSVDVPLKVSGFSATGQIGTVLVWGLINTDQTPNWTIIKEAA
jgi:hypothetical protein